MIGWWRRLVARVERIEDKLFTANNELARLMNEVQALKLVQQGAKAEADRQRNLIEQVNELAKLVGYEANSDRWKAPALKWWKPRDPSAKGELNG